MTMIARTSLATCLALAAGGFAAAGVTCPNDFEDTSNALGPLFAYFGGVTSWGAAQSDVLVSSGHSLNVWANLVNDSFTAAGFAVGTFGISPPALAVPAGADTFSITITAPTNGTLSLAVTLREDDNGDNAINVNSNDDAWVSGVFMLEPGTHVYNIPLSSFTDDNDGTGNDVQNFATTGRLAYMLTFESRDSYPGGQIVGPVSFHVDHVGLFTGAQEIPSSAAPGDVTGDGAVDIDDLFAVINAWGPCPAPPQACAADISGDDAVDVDDLFMVINNWN